MTLTTEHVFSVEVLLAPPVEVGSTPEGFRRVVPIVGGVVSQGLDGVVLPGGADWSVVLPDGSAHLWARYELTLADGAVVSVTNVARLAAGAEPPFLTSPTFEVGAGGPTGLRTGLYVGVLRPDEGGHAVHLDVYRAHAG